MKIIRKISWIAASLPLFFQSCDNADNIGNSLLPTENRIIVDTDFDLTGTVIPNEEIQSRSINQLIGDIDAKGYGKFHSDFVTQFMPAAQLDPTLTSASDIDSVRLVMMFNDGSFVGDSVIPMGLEVFKLTKPLKAPIFSNFDPEGYYNPNQPLAKYVYGASDNELPDSLKSLTYKTLAVKLPNSIGTEIFDLYQSKPESFLDPAAFGKEFNGLYVKSNYGSGRVTKIEGTIIQFFYHYNTKTAADKDTIINQIGNFLSVAPEVISNNNIRYQRSEDLTQRIDNNDIIIIAPAGTDVQIEFPIIDVLSSYHRQKGQLSVLNDLTLQIPATKISNDYSINPPQNLLLILKDKKREFFEQSKITDGKTSFYGTYNPTTGMYSFTSMRQYLIDALANEAELSPEDWTFIITPVSIVKEKSNSYYDTTEYISTITPYIAQPSMVQLELDKAIIELTFSTQTLKD